MGDALATWVEANVALQTGAGNITRSKLLSGVFCDLDEAQAKKLSRIPGLKIKPLKEYKTDQVMAETPPVETISDVFWIFLYNNPCI